MILWGLLSGGSSGGDQCRVLVVLLGGVKGNQDADKNGYQDEEGEVEGLAGSQRRNGKVSMVGGKY